LIQVGQEGNRDFPMIIIANKIDLKEERVVSRKELQVRSSLPPSPSLPCFFAPSCRGTRRVCVWLFGLVLCSPCAVVLGWC
jgi:GTPase SAR1 family protein